MANTGYKAWKNLNLVNKTTGAILETKANVDTDPDYVAPEWNPTECPVPDDEKPTFTTSLAVQTEIYEANLSWASSDNIGVSEHVVYWKRTGDTAWSSVVLAGTATSHVLKQLYSKTEYQFYVVAKDAAGNSTTSNLVIMYTKYLTISPTSKSVSADLSSFDITIDTDTGWHSSEALSWAAISANKGTVSNPYVTVTVDANPNTTSRSGTVYIKSDDGNVSAGCNISQAAKQSVWSTSLGTDGTGDLACNATKSTYYIDTDSFSTAGKIWTDSGGTTAAPAGYYSDGFDHRYWDGSYLGASTACGTGGVSA